MTPEIIALVAFVLGAALGIAAGAALGIAAGAALGIAAGAALGIAAGYALCRRMNRKAEKADKDYMERMIETASPSNMAGIHRAAAYRAAAYRDIERHFSKYSVGVSENAVRKDGVLW